MKQAPKGQSVASRLVQTIPKPAEASPLAVNQPLMTVAAAAEANVSNTEAIKTEYDDDFAEARRLALRIKYKDLVSVAFCVRNKCIKVNQCLSLFDSGSPTCFVKQSMVPFIITSETFESKFSGLGKNKLSTFGTILCKIDFNGETYDHFFYILPDSEAIVPLLIGRDLMRKMGIDLYQIKHAKKKMFSKNELLNLNKTIKERNISEATTDALKSFHLFKHPVQNKTEVPINLSNVKISNLENDLCIGAIDFENKDTMKEIEQVILLIDTEETESKMNINTQLSVAQAEALQSIIQDEYLNKIGDRRIRTFSMEIKLIDNKPMHSSPRRLSYG